MKRSEPQRARQLSETLHRLFAIEGNSIRDHALADIGCMNDGPNEDYRAARISVPIPLKLP